MRGSNKRICHFAVHGIDVEAVDREIEVAVAAVCGFDIADGHFVLHGCFGILHMDILLLIFHAKAVDRARAEAARPAVFVVAPRRHAALLSVHNGGADVVEPFVAHIFGFQAAARVHKIAADAVIVHLFDLFERFGCFELCIPRPERQRPVFFRRIL